MNLCERCKKGQLEMCEHFRENYLESGQSVRNCPKFEADRDEVEVIDVNRRAGKIRLVAGQAIRKALSGERIMMLTSCPAETGAAMMRAVFDWEFGDQMNGVTMVFDGGGEIVIGGEEG